MKPARSHAEGEENENVLELFLDVLLCGFGAALALVVVYSVLPKSGQAALTRNRPAGQGVQQNAAAAAPVPGAQPVWMITLEDDADPASGAVEWIVRADDQTAAVVAELPSARCAPIRDTQRTPAPGFAPAPPPLFLPVPPPFRPVPPPPPPTPEPDRVNERIVMVLPAGHRQFTLLAGANFQSSGISAIRVQGFFDGWSCEAVLSGDPKKGFHSHGNDDGNLPPPPAAAGGPPDNFTPLLRFDLVEHKVSTFGLSPPPAPPKP